MIVHEISFYSQFKCAMGACPNTCCHGWQIVLDDETCEKYKKEPGLTGIRLRCGVTRRGGMTMFKHRRGTCPFLTEKRTCGIQISLGEDYMPDVCRIFPRQRINYGLFAEETLLLACPEAARLFLHSLDRLYFQNVQKNVCYRQQGTNEDSAYLQELLDVRSAMTAGIADMETDRRRLCSGLLLFADRLQQYYIHKAADTTAGSSLTPPSLPNCIEISAPAFRITADMTGQMISGGFYHILLKKTAPFLFRLCRLYRKQFGRLHGARADARADELRARLSADHPEMERVLRGHLSYYLLSEFLSAYESYSFVRIILTGLMHMHLLELFAALYYDNTHSLTEAELVRIIAALDRRGRHCKEVENAMYLALSPLLRSYSDESGANA